jgi:hypothetical protein
MPGRVMLGPAPGKRMSIWIALAALAAVSIIAWPYLKSAVRMARHRT